MPRFVNAHAGCGARITRVAFLCLSLLVFGCSSSPTQPESNTETLAEIEIAPAEEPRQSRAERRRARRAAEDGVDGEQDEAAPIPSAATQAYDRALAAMLSGDDTEAELELEQLTLEYPEYPGPYVNLAILYQDSGRTEEAREALSQALAIDPGHPAANNQLGILNRTEGQFSEAEEAYLRAIEADPYYELAHYNLGVLLDLYLRRPADALGYYESYQALQTEPDETVGRWIIDLRRRVGAPAGPPQVAQEDGS